MCGEKRQAFHCVAEPAVGVTHARRKQADRDAHQDPRARRDEKVCHWHRPSHQMEACTIPAARLVPATPCAAVGSPETRSRSGQAQRQNHSVGSLPGAKCPMLWLSPSLTPRSRMPCLALPWCSPSCTYSPARFAG